MNEDFKLGMFIGAVIMFIGWTAVECALGNDAKAIKKCELELPRSQHCKLIAVPEIPTPPEKGE